MKTFSFTELNQTPGKIVDEALQEPVVLTKRGKERLVLIRYEDWAELTKKRRDPRYVGKTFEMPPELATEVLREIDNYLQKDDE